MPKITARTKDEVVHVTTSTKKKGEENFKWWNAGSKKELASQVLDTAIFLKEQQSYRLRQADIFAKMYGNFPLHTSAGTTLGKMSINNALPVDRPTMNVIQSAIDTLTSRITQSRPRPVFLTDNSDYKQRNLAKQLNQFIQGELFQTKAYQLGEFLLRDASVFGTGCVKVYEDNDNRVALDRVLDVDLLTDPNDSFMGAPRQLHQFCLVDRDVLIEKVPRYKSDIEKAENAYITNQETARSVSDQVMVVESWHLPSGKIAKDGMHTIVCSEGILFEESWTKDKFPFGFLRSSPRVMGMWGQGTAERLFGTQYEINKLLITISNSINLVGVPRVFVEEGSKIVKSHLNNNVGSIVFYRGIKPSYEVAPCVPAELYDQLQRLINYAYQQEGISQLAASSQKPQGLNSGVAMREYDDLQTDRFAALSKRYDNLFVDLAYQIIDLSKDIAERDGKYQTVYPNKDGTKEIDLPAAKLLDDPFVIQCYDASSLPRDPAGRLAKVTELMQAGLISPEEGRRLLDYPDLEQNNKLATSKEERIMKDLDDIIETGKYNPPDQFTDLLKADELCTQYINLYSTAKLEDEKIQKLKDYFTQVQDLKQMATPPAPPMGAVPQAPPQPMQPSPMVPQV